MRQYPIWVEIRSCIYKKPKSYGVKEHSRQQVKIGTSRSNSHDFADVELSHHKRENGDRVYTLSVDGKIIKKAILRNECDKPETVIEVR
jgi:hypothetical protein